MSPSMQSPNTRWQRSLLTNACCHHAMHAAREHTQRFMIMAPCDHSRIRSHQHSFHPEAKHLFIVEVFKCLALTNAGRMPTHPDQDCDWIVKQFHVFHPNLLLSRCSRSVKYSNSVPRPSSATSCSMALCTHLGEVHRHHWNQTPHKLDCMHIQV